MFSKFSSVQEIADKLGPIIQSPLDDELGHTSEQMNNVCSKLQTVMDFSDAKLVNIIIFSMDKWFCHKFDTSDQSGEAGGSSIFGCSAEGNAG